MTIAARGKYSVASNLEEIDVHGYMHGEKQSYSLAELNHANHGAAMALIGAIHESHTAVLVGPCTATVASLAGQIFVGVNDREVANNRGSISFAVRVGLPTLEQWRSGGAFECARQPGRGDQAR